ncbi:MAG: tryptophan-rich sensory protein [Acidobacteria bacterium]|nr:tryptophan-rich sensory protein [Acidobacteriota bacterium]
MTEKTDSAGTLAGFAVAAATLLTIGFNWLAAAGMVGGVTPAEISAKYPTAVTPAGYAFSIWSLIYLGMIAYSVYQLSSNASPQARSIRWLYVVTCLLNCGWIYFWHHDYIAVCLGLIAGLAFTLFLINQKLKDVSTTRDFWLTKAPFGLYFGWVTAATLVNFAILLASRNVETGTLFAVGLILVAGTFGILFRVTLRNYIYPLAIAWAVTAISVKQSGQTAIVATGAFVVIVCLIATLSFVVNLPSTDHPRDEAK